MRNSGFRGVVKTNNRWRATINVNGKRIHIGYFNTQADAYRARQETMVKIGRIDDVSDLEDEEWKISPLLGEPIWVSNKGRVKTTNFNRMEIEKLYVFQKGWRGRYYTVVIGCKRYMVHRLVMDAFVGQSELEVNHKDGDDFNNWVENLEYVTHRENISHGFGGASGATLTDGYWQCALKIDGKSKTVGYFKTKEEAHQKYLDTLEKLGETNKYAVLNRK
jgi:hypothetical protein